MELDEKLKAKIASLNDEELRAGILAVARQMGVADRKAEAKLGDMKKIKKTLANFSQKDLDRVAAKMGKEKSEELMRAVEREANKK